MSILFQKAENENEERKRQEEAERQAEMMMRNQKNKAKTLPSIEKAWNYTHDSDAYDDEEDDDDTSSGGSDSSWEILHECWIWDYLRYEI